MTGWLDGNDWMVGREVCTTYRSWKMVYESTQAICSDPAQAVPKGNSYRLVGDFKAVNHQSESVATSPMLLEE